MDHERFMYSTLIGLAAFAFIFAGLTTRFQDRQTRKALWGGSVAIGGMVGMWYYQNPDEIQALLDTIVGQATAVVLAAVMAAVIFWKIRSFFLG